MENYGNGLLKIQYSDGQAGDISSKKVIRFHWKDDAVQEESGTNSQRGGDDQSTSGSMSLIKKTNGIDSLDKAKDAEASKHDQVLMEYARGGVGLHQGCSGNALGSRCENPRIISTAGPLPHKVARLGKTIKLGQRGDSILD